MKRKISILLAGAMIAATIFTGCGKKDKDDSDSKKVDIDAETLVNQAFSDLKDAPYISAKGSIAVDVQIDLGMLMGGTQAGQMMDMKLDGAMSFEHDLDTEYNEIDMSMEFAGQKKNQLSKQWRQKTEGTNQCDVYEYDEESGQWTHSIEDNEDEDDQFDSSMIKDAKVVADGDGYKLTGSIDISKLSEIGGEKLDTSQFASFLDGADFKITLLFDADKKMTSISLGVDKLKTDTVVVNKFSIAINNISMGGNTQLDLPAELAGADDDFDDYDIDDEGFDDADVDDEFENPSDITSAGAEIQSLLQKLSNSNFQYMDSDIFYQANDEMGESVNIIGRVDNGDVQVTLYVYDDESRAQSDFNDISEESISNIFTAYNLDNAQYNDNDNLKMYMVYENDFPSLAYVLENNMIYVIYAKVDVDGDMDEGKRFYESYSEFLSCFE